MALSGRGERACLVSRRSEVLTDDEHQALACLPPKQETTWLTSTASVETGDFRQRTSGRLNRDSRGRLTGLLVVARLAVDR